MILVKFEDGSFRKVPAELLGRLISFKEITHFRRSSGWVEVPRGEVRTHYSPGYIGPERRRHPRGRGH